MKLREWIGQFSRQKQNRQARKVMDKLCKETYEQMGTWESALRLVSTKEGENPEAFALINSIVYIRITLGDLFYAAKYYYQTDEYWEKRFCAKLLCLSLYEFYHDVPTVYGKNFRSAITKLDSSGALAKTVSSIMRMINRLKEEAQKNLSNIRNNAVAHKEHNSLLQLDVVRGIDLPWLEAHVILVATLALEIWKLEKEVRDILYSHRGAHESGKADG